MTVPMGRSTRFHSEFALTQRALTGDTNATLALFELLRPVVARRVLRVVRSSQRASSLGAEPDDLVQDVFAWLLMSNRRVLRAWDARKGLSLRNFIGLACERYVRSKLRAREQPLCDLDRHLEHAIDPRNPESQVAARRMLSSLACKLERQLTPLGRELFCLLYVEEQSVGHTSEALAMSADAIYAWKSRLRRLLGSLLIRMLDDDPQSFPLAGPRNRTPLTSGMPSKRAHPQTPYRSSSKQAELGGAFFALVRASMSDNTAPTPIPSREI